MKRDNIKKYPMRAHGITTDSKGANLLGGISYSTTTCAVFLFRILICITIQEFCANSALLSNSGGLSC
jgi:hypothetical protein